MGDSDQAGWLRRSARGARITVGILVYFYVLLLGVAAWGTGQAALPPAIFSTVASAFVAVVVHELGHAIAATVSGHKVVVFAARPLAWHVHNRRLVYMARKYQPDVGGFVFSVPVEPAGATLFRRRLIVAGGPFASALLALIGLAYGAPALGNVAPAEGFPAADPRLLVFGLGVFSAWLTALSLLPHPTQNHRSDGQQLWAMRGGFDLALYRLAVLAGYSKYTVRLRDWPAWLLRDIAAAPPPMDDLDKAMGQWAIGRALDAEVVDIIGTRSLLDRFRAAHGDSEWLASCDAYFTAVWEADWRGAELKLWRAESALVDQALLHAAAAAVTARGGDAAATEKHLGEMRKEIAKRSVFPDLTFRDIGRRIESVLSDVLATKTLRPPA
jgi:hypothetical protein